MKHVDTVIDSFLNELGELECLDESLIIITSDHGEEFLDHGDFGHKPKLYDELIRVPLIIRDPDIKRGEIVDELVELLDIPPTILGSIGAGRPPDFLGKDLLETSVRKENPDSCAISEVAHSRSYPWIIDHQLRKTACRSKKWKFILDQASDRSELYNLHNDPGETNNLVNEEKSVGRKLVSGIKNHKVMEVRVTGQAVKRLYIKKKINNLKSFGKI